ncbi:MAG: putative bifunctional diguanylate cyclase/phosphodiesterase, partial [Acidimicrobiales bacterium]
IDERGEVLYQSPASWQMLGRQADELVGTNFADWLHPEDAVSMQRTLSHLRHFPDAEETVSWRLRTSAGGYVGVESRITNLLDNAAVSGIVINSRDVSDRMRLEEELRHQAFHDPLTGLANRALFRDRVEHALSRLDRTGGAMGVLFLDLDDFKAVNDARGHGVGDELLRAVSGRLRNTVRAGDTLARLGGDEFALLVEGSDGASAAEWGARILDAFKVPFAVGGGESSVRASVGIATTGEGGTTVEELLRNADIAMYAAKNAGKGRYELFHSGLHERVVDRIHLEADLGHAVHGDELAVQYQAIVDLKSGRMTGVEALMRWHHPRRGLVMPNEFIPLAEATGLIVPMGRWLMHRACMDTRAIQEEAERFDLHLAVNISARQLDDPALVHDVESALAASGLSSNLLTLEITESVFMSDPDNSLDVLLRLKDLGVKLSIDDFGTGYSSLSYLQRLPVDELKIDRSFVGAEQGHEPGGLVETIVRLASNFGLTTVAEGIETEAQRLNMQEAGCEMAQGFLFARPVDVSQIHNVLALQDAHATLRTSITNTRVSLGAIPLPGELEP